MINTSEDVLSIAIDTGIEGAGENDVLTVTQRAIDVINSVRAQNEITEDFALRLGTRSGGCSGMSYALGFDSNISDIDRTYEANGLKLVIDHKSIFYFLGVTLDYTEGPDGSGFVFVNPNNFHSCGCSG